jgi:hypothetical protein
MKTLIPIFLLALASGPVFADPPTLYSVECSITPKEKEAKTTRVAATNVDLEEHALMLPIVSPANETLIINVVLVRKDSHAPANAKKKGDDLAEIQVNIQDPSRITSSRSEHAVTPLQVFSAQLPYKPKETLPLFENNDFTLSIQVKTSASK